MSVTGGGAWRPILPAPLPLPSPLPPWDASALHVATWHYRDGDGRLLFAVARFNLLAEDGAALKGRTGKARKRVPALVCGEDAGGIAWRWLRYPPVPCPLYGLDRLAARPAAPVLVLEGEKAADAATEILPGFVAVTWPGGCDRASNADWSPLAGRRVVVLADNDTPGRRGAAVAARRVRRAGAARVRELHPPRRWPLGWDVADPLPPGTDPCDLAAMVSGAADGGA